MTQLSSAQHRTVAAYWADINYVMTSIRADFSLNDIQAAVASVDQACDTTLNAAVAGGFGSLTVVQAVASNMPAPFNGANAQQKSLLVAYTIMKRAGVI